MESELTRLDHFQIYDIFPMGVNYDGAFLEGQFDKVPKEVNIKIFEHIATPVSKNGAPIQDENAHFTGYVMRTPRPEPERTVVIRNQFGTQELRIGLATVLLVPAEKLEPGLSFPAGLDHYECYRVVVGDSVDRDVSLRDQFDSRTGVPVTFPLLFCVPVVKTYGKETTTISRPRAHLTFYRIEPEEYSIPRTFSDQFATTDVTVVRSVMLGVPTKKIKWAVAPDFVAPQGVIPDPMPLS